MAQNAPLRSYGVPFQIWPEELTTRVNPFPRSISTPSPLSHQSQVLPVHL